MQLVYSNLLWFYIQQFFVKVMQLVACNWLWIYGQMFYSVA